MSDIRSTECSQFELGTSVYKIKVCLYECSCQGVCVTQKIPLCVIQKIPVCVTEEQRHAPFVLKVPLGQCTLVSEMFGHYLYIVRHRTWLWLSVSKAGAQVPVASVQGYLQNVLQQRKGMLVMERSLLAWNSDIYCDGAVCYPLKPALRGGNWESPVTCPVAGSLQPLLGFVSASQCSIPALALAQPAALRGHYSSLWNLPPSLPV